MSKKRTNKKTWKPVTNACLQLPADKRVKTELLINQLLARCDWEGASVLLEAYMDQYGDDVSYDHLNVFGDILQKAKKLEAAHAVFTRAIKLDGSRYEAPEGLFWLYFEMGDKQCDTVLRRLLEDGPESRRIDYLYWGALRANNIHEHAQVLDLVEQAGGLPDPSYERFSEVSYAYLNALCASDRAQEALDRLEAISLASRHGNKNFELIGGIILRTLGRTQDAIEHYTQVLTRMPDLPEARWNRGLARLELGDLGGWQDYEIRWQWEGFPSKLKKMSARMWNGESLDGKKILLWGEQGLGDQVLFLTLALPIIKANNAQVTIEVLPKLIGLVKTWYPEAEVRALNTFDCIGDPDYDDYDYQLPVGSLPVHFMNTQASIRQRPIRFLRPNLDFRRSFIERFNISPDQTLLGVCWRSSNIEKSRVLGYLNVQFVVSLANELPDNVTLVTLQYGITPEERAVLDACRNVVIPDVDFFEDVSAHAMHIGICDLVVAPRTLTLQLAGLFGRNTLSWGIDGWSFLGERQYPWYPTIASLALEKNFSHSSLVYALKKWVDVALEHLYSQSDRVANDS